MRCGCVMVVLVLSVAAVCGRTGLVITSLSPAGNDQVELVWSNAALYGYVVEKSSTLPWEVDGFELVVPEDGADPVTTSFTTFVTNALSRFYRITQGPPRTAIDDWDGRQGTTNNDVLILVGTYSNNWYVQHGFRGSDTLYMSGSAGNDWLRQSGGDGNDTMTASGGTGDNRIFQHGGGGDDSLSAGGGSDNDRIVQVGGDGHDLLGASASGGSDDVTIYAGDGDDIIKVSNHEGPDHVFVDAGPGNDRITNDVSWSTTEGTTFRIDGGLGTDHLALRYSKAFFTVKDEGGTVLYQTGTNAVCTVSSIEDITYSLGLYTPTGRVEIEQDGNKVVEILATASRAGETLSLSRGGGVTWATVSGQGTMSSPDEFLRGELAFYPPSGWTGREWVNIRLTGTHGGVTSNTVLVEVGEWE